ncbi:MAG: hypothetical protein EOO38_29560 [Cytophagaceae bacterium]|nr:MAG: hypothetical protein EOO38_29560 [Cytophagaceae bacterium]
MQNGGSNTDGMQAMPISYAANMHYLGYNGQAGNSEAIVQSPSIKILLGETSAGQTTIGAADWTGPDIWLERGYSGHLGTANYLFGDGHVKSLQPTRTMGTGFNMWGAFTDTTGPSCSATGWNAGADAGNPNCDSPSAGASNALAALANKYK